MHYREIKLTPLQAEAWDWATDACNDYLADPEQTDMPAIHDAVFPVDNGIGAYLDNPEVVADLVYRFDTQYCEMADEAVTYGDITRQKCTAINRAMADLVTALKGEK